MTEEVENKTSNLLNALNGENTTPAMKRVIAEQMLADAQQTLKILDEAEASTKLDPATATPLVVEDGPGQINPEATGLPAFSYLKNGVDTRLKLGCKAKTLIDGLEGIVMHRIEFFNGGVHLAVHTPGAKPGELGTETQIDIQSLDYIDEGISARVTQPKPGANCGIELGNEVEDLMTGFSGTANRRDTSINGCVHYEVVPREKKQKPEKTKLKKNAKGQDVFTISERSRPRWIPAERLGITGVGIAPISAKVTAENTAGEQAPPGPATVTVKAGSRF